MMNAQRRMTAVVMCVAGLLVLGAYTAFEPMESSAAPDASTTTTSTPAPTTTLRDRADGLPFKLPDPSVFPTSVAIPVAVEAGAKFQVTVTCPFIAEEPLSVLNANLDAVATPDINPNPVDLLWPPGIDLQLIADSAIPDDNGVFTFYPVAPTETGTYYIRAACTFSESWGDDVVLLFSDGTAYSWYTYTPPELMHRIEVVPPTPPLDILPDCL